MATAAPTRTPRALRGKMAVPGSKTGLLGFIALFSVPDRPVKLQELKRAWLKGGLERACLPKDPRALHLFKRAVRAQQGRVKHEDGSITETVVKDVLDSEHFVIYQISRVVRDVEEREVTFPKMLTVIYNKEAEDISFKRGEGVRLAMTAVVQEEILDYFEGNTKVVDGRKVRTLVRNYLKDNTDEQADVFGLSGENLRGKAGGVYFVTAKHQQRLEGLAECLEELYGKGGDEMYGLYMVEVADSRKARELVRDAHVANTVKEAKEAIRDMSKVIEKDRVNAVRSDVARFWFRKVQALRRQTAEYSSILGEESGEVESILEMLAKQQKALPVA